MHPRQSKSQFLRPFCGLDLEVYLVFLDGLEGDDKKGRQHFEEKSASPDKILATLMFLPPLRAVLHMRKLLRSVSIFTPTRYFFIPFAPVEIASFDRFSCFMAQKTCFRDIYRTESSYCRLNFYIAGIRPIVKKY